jgi:hypothetical protein
MHSNPLLSLTRDDVLPITAQGYILHYANLAAWAAIPYRMTNMQNNVSLSGRGSWLFGT